MGFGLPLYTLSPKIILFLSVQIILSKHTGDKVENSVKVPLSK